MKKIKYLFAISILASTLSCGNSSTADELEKQLENTEGSVSKTSQSTSKVTLSANGETYEINGINQRKSYLQFYTSESTILQDGNFRIASDKDEKSLTVIVDGLNAKGLDQISGTVRFEENNSLVLYKDGDLEIRFTSGDLVVNKMEKKSGKVEVSANGKCAIKVGKSYTDMQIDVPATLRVESQITDIKTLDYKR